MAQVIISPYVVYIDEQDKFGSYLVQNESNQEYEISVYFKFGHPVSDSAGNASMKYYEEIPDTLPSIVDWIRAFPRKFILPPRERQIIRMTVRPPSDIDPGTYWARIITSSVPRARSVDTQTSGVSAKINFVINQATTVLYRTGVAETSVAVDTLFAVLDTTGLQIIASIKREGNTPFFGDVDVVLLNNDSIMVDTKKEYINLYFDMIKKYTFPTDSLRAGNYKAELTITHNEKDDIPDSKLTQIPPIIKSIKFEIP
ncbi:MAG: hypothetical protein JW995_01420 [Melioribacteraceae bacterium]|nr:hypothetical protein [Melioribacteraceae bacterium]